MKATNATNKNQRLNFVKKIIDFYGEDLSHLAFGVWGLSYKPKTNDMREAPSITILNELLAKGAKIKAYDPKAMERAKLIFGNKISYAQSAYEALENVDGLLLITEWNEFRIPDFDKVKQLMKTPVIFDGRNQYNSRLLKEHGFKYFCIGKVPLL
jgi:UDPglucose 6-dehydrogenase